MLSTKTNTKEKSTAPPRLESKKSEPEKGTPQIQLNPLWHSMTTHVGGKTTAGASRDPNSNQSNSSSSTNASIIQRMCAECDEEAAEGVQTKQLTVGAPNDQFEQEADAISDRVMRMPADRLDEVEQQEPADIQTKVMYSSRIQRMCTACETEQDQPSIQARSNGSKAQPSVPGSVANTVHSPGSGSPMNDSVRSRIEPVLGADLSNVRIHSGDAAQQASRSLNAQAFTHRNNIFLGSGQSANNTALMAHEATHVVQQGAGLPSPRIQRRIVMRTTTPQFAGGSGAAATGTTENLRPVTTAEVESYIDDIGTVHHDFDDIISGTGEEFGFVASESYRRSLIIGIIRNLHRVSTDLFFDNYREAVREIRKRALISLIMRASQGRSRGTRPTGYPRSCRPAGPRVSEAAGSYWIVHPDAGDVSYWFELSSDGRSNAHEALRTLIFNHQSSACLRTLMHCDYMIAAQQFFVMADTMGATDFNQAVTDGNINLVIRWNSFENIVADTPTSDGQFQSLQSVNLSSESDFIIGDHVMFFNHDAFDDMNEVRYNVRGDYSNWRLENAIISDIDASGEFRFQGHGYFSPKRRSEFVNDMAAKMNGLVAVANSAISAGNTGHLGFSMSNGSRFEVVRPAGAGGGWSIYYHQGLGTEPGLPVTNTALRRFSASDYPNPFARPGSTAIRVRRPIESRRASIGGTSGGATLGSGASPLPEPTAPMPPAPAPSSPSPAAPAPAEPVPTVPAPRPISPAPSPPSPNIPSPGGRTPTEPVAQPGGGQQQQRPVSVSRHSCDTNESNPVIWFEYNTTNIRSSGGVNSIVHLMMATERARAHIAAAGPDARIYLYGFASEEGDETHNLDLARRRALVVKSLLEAAGIDPTNLVAVAVGEDASMGSLAMNRRVEICPTPVIDYIDMPEETVTADNMDCSAPTQASNLTEYAFLVRCLEAQLATTHGPVDILRTLRELYYGNSKFDNAACGDRESGTVTRLRRTVPDLMNALYDGSNDSKVISGVDVGHIFTGLEGMLCPRTETSPVWYAPSVNMSNEDFLTWGGDIGSAAAGRLNGYNASGWIFKNDPPWDRYFLESGTYASREDLLGDIDAFVFRANLRGVPCSSTKDTRMPAPSTPISRLFLDFYGAPPGMATGLTSADRFRCFTEATGGVISGTDITNKPALVNRYWQQVLSFARLFYMSLGRTHILTFDVGDMAKLIEYSRDITERFFDWIDEEL